MKNLLFLIVTQAYEYTCQQQQDSLTEEGLISICNCSTIGSEVGETENFYLFNCK